MTDDRDDALHWIQSGEEHMALLPRNPESAYLFWEITEAGIARAESGHDGEAPARLLGRWEVVDASDSPSSHEFDLETRVGSRFIEWLTSAPHRARIGWYASRDTFVEIARSTVVVPPSDRPGAEPVRWIERDESGVYRLESVDDDPRFSSLDLPSTDESPSSS